MSKEKKSNLILYVIIFLSGFLVCLILLFFVKKYFFYDDLVSIQFDPVNVLSIIVNILLVFYVASVLNRKNEEERTEKDVLIKYLKKFQNNLGNDINIFLNSKKLKFSDVVSGLKTFRQEFNSVGSLIKKYKYDYIVSDVDVCMDIDSCIRDINDSFTNTIKSNNNKLTIDNNQISIGTKSRQDIEKANLKIKERIFDLIVLINRK